MLVTSKCSSLSSIAQISRILIFIGIREVKAYRSEGAVCRSILVLWYTKIGRNFVITSNNTDVKEKTRLVSVTHEDRPAKRNHHYAVYTVKIVGN